MSLTQLSKSHELDSARHLQSASAGIAAAFVAYKTRLKLYEDEIAMFKCVLDACPVPMFLTNVAGDMVYVNEPYLKMLGAERDDVTGTGWLNFIHPEDKLKMDSHWISLVDSNSVRIDCQVRYVKMDGSVLSVSMRICRVFSGNYSGFIVQP